jgi:hypothetical protein
MPSGEDTIKMITDVLQDESRLIETQEASRHIMVGWDYYNGRWANGCHKLDGVIKPVCAPGLCCSQMLAVWYGHDWGKGVQKSLRPPRRPMSRNVID